MSPVEPTAPPAGLPAVLFSAIATVVLLLVAAPFGHSHGAPG